MGKRRRGLTLLECLVASAVLAMLGAAVIVPFSVGAQAAAQDARTTLAVALAQDMMEEILSHSFKDPNGTEAGESGRPTWDDMRDYDQFFENEGNIYASDGTLVGDPMAAYLSRRASVQAVYVSGQNQSLPASFLCVTVYVYYHGDQLIKLTRLVYDNT
jgi:prepilin-type N-terminal cleavage/methylation domain-containing protein